MYLNWTWTHVIDTSGRWLSHAAECHARLHLLAWYRVQAFQLLDSL